MSNQQVLEQLDRHLNFLAQDEDNLSLLVKVSSLYVELNDFNNAQEYLDRANSINRIACLGHQGLLHLNRGLFSEAKESFIEALDHEDTAALRYNLGFAHFITSDLESAAEVLSPVIDDAYNPEAKQLMARIHHGQGNLQEALTLINEVLGKDADDPDALGLLALLQFDLDESELAKETATHTLELDPENYDAKIVLNMLGLTTQETSIEEVEKLLQINPNDCRLWFTLGSAQMGEGNFAAAYESLNKALEIYPDFYDCSIALGWCLLLQDKLQDAFTVYESASVSIPEQAEAWGGLALIHALQENIMNAEKFVEHALALNDDCFLAEIAQVIVYNHKDPQQAQKHLIDTLRDTQIPVSEKLAFLIENMYSEPGEQVH